MKLKITIFSFFFTCLSFFAPVSVFGAITIGDTSSGGQASGASLTVSHIVASGEILVVGAMSAKEGEVIITGCTYNGDAMTLADEQIGTDALYTSIYYLLAPDTGTHDIICSNNTSASGSTISALSFAGANTSSVGASNSTYQSSASSISTALTTTNANSYVVALACRNGSTDALTPTGTNQTQRTNVVGESRCYTSTQTTTTAGSYTNAWSSSPNQIMSQVVLEIKEGSASSGTYLNATSTEAMIQTTNFGIAIIIVLLFMQAIWYFWGNITPKKPWK